MKRKLTALGWAGAMLAFALVSVPAAGQEKPVMKTGVAENVSAQDVQLQADGEWMPDSAVVYSPGGEKQTKHVYLPGESHGQYTWENGAWKFSSSNPATGYVRSTIYDREKVNVQYKVSYKIEDGWLYFCYPFGIKNRYGGYGPRADQVDFTPEFDTNGNLTSFRIIFGANSWQEFTVTYNAKNKPLSIEGRNEDNTSFFKAYYAYNDYEYVTLSDIYVWYQIDDTWKNDKETVEYDTQGKPLSQILYNNGEITDRYSYEYYDGNHYSSKTTTDGNNTGREEWKYGTDGKPGAYYWYIDGELQEYVIFYPNTLSPSAVEPVPERVATRVWSSGGQLYIAAASAGRAQIYTVAGQLMATVALAAGETIVTPLPPGVYIVAAEGRTWKAVIR
jgi:hypothetical protein